ncbi:MAG: putative Transaldolase [Candidatus Magasanikbacteria bacterium GW2011_GWA2_56_11]|uniref:Putative Transaldolase n=1 Tax=Candidatus Magasanikbacteria bacterium GW2011_GWA2_56_11 TaxID=1619044 RepID=A0A0G2BA43_9BACT|nr:MAG: putative Transaldolase [Candidatus Magasanikbacteria bacterium GW2011_GWA2_56_11]
MQFFVDTANLADIEAALRRGFVRGVTTNPSLLSKEPKSSFKEHVVKIIGLIQEHQPGSHLSIEVFSRDPDEILRQAEQFAQEFNYPQMSIKVQVGWNELETIAKLKAEGVSVNCTACMTVGQAMMAAAAGARYVSLFWGRIRDAGREDASAEKRSLLLADQTLDQSDFDPAMVVRRVRELLEDSELAAEIIVGSIRSVVDVRDAALAGAHIVTIPPKFFPVMSNHYKTDQVVDQFLKDFSGWM